jgi:hypothetical protein
VRFSQLINYLAPEANKPNKEIHYPASTLIKRMVWTKESKGAVALRKLVVWKTNKNEIDRNYPAYVVHWTDYSAGRASPLDRDVRLAPSEAEAMKIADEMVLENIKKGWNVVEV